MEIIDLGLPSGTKWASLEHWLRIFRFFNNCRIWELRME